MVGAHAAMQVGFRACRGAESLIRLDPFDLVARHNEDQEEAGLGLTKFPHA